MKLGQTVMTRGINNAIAESEDFAKFVTESFKRYLRYDWGNLCDEDKEMNDLALKNDNDRIVARYDNISGNIYIITEWDRSATTILFCNEY